MKRQSEHERQIVPREQKKGSPVGGVPTGLDSGSFQYTDLDNDLSDGNSETEALELEAPKNLRVKSQVIKFSPDGAQTTDVVFEFDSVEGAREYELRITPV